MLKGIPTIIEENILDERFTDLDNLKQIDKFSIEMKHGINSIVYLFLAKETNDQLIIYHQGHDGGFINGEPTINYFLDKGYSVMAFSMPLVGMNNQPIINVEHLGPVKFIEHKYPGHYIRTPYAYQSKLGRKYIPPMHVDLGQGMLQVIDELTQANYKKK